MNNNQASGKPELGIALGGGAALGAAHIGVLKAFAEANIEFDCLTGTSIGSCIAALYVFGMDLEAIQEIMADLNWLSITNLNPSKLGLLGNDKLGDIVRQSLGEVTFEDAPKRLAIVTTDIATGEKIVLDSGPIEQAIMASCAIPGLFSPVEVNGRLLVDGGLAENVPVDTLRAMGVETSIGVDLVEKTVLMPPTTLVDIVVNMTYILLARARSNELEQADHIITPDTSSFSMVKTNQVAGLVEVGYEAAAELVEEIKRYG